MTPEEQASQIVGRIAGRDISRFELDGIRLQIVNAIRQALREEQTRWAEALGVPPATHRHPARAVPEALNKAVAVEREGCAKVAEELGAAQAAAAIRKRC